MIDNRAREKSESLYVERKSLDMERKQRFTDEGRFPKQFRKQELKKQIKETRTKKGFRPEAP